MKLTDLFKKKDKKEVKMEDLEKLNQQMLEKAKKKLEEAKAS